MSRVLFIAANAFSKNLNNGKTYEAMFSKFEREELYQLFFRPQDLKYLDLTYAKEYFSVSELDILYKMLGKKKQCGNILSNKSVIEDNNGSLKKENSLYCKLANNPLSKSNFIKNAIWSTKLWKSRKLKAWCEKVNPDVIFVVLGPSAYLYDVTNQICDWLNKPLAIFYTDDYVVFPSKYKQLSNSESKRLHKSYRQIIDRASLCYCIGEEMAEVYSSYFSKKFLPIMNSVDIVPFEEKFCQDQKLIMSYFGGLHLGRWKMLARLAKIVENRGVIHVYTATEVTEEIKQVFDESGIILEGFIEPSLISSEMKKADILLHVESNDLQYRSLTRLSVSTKIPEYLISGRLLLAFGPTEVASIKLLSDHNVGCVIDADQSDEMCKSTINKLIGRNDQIHGFVCNAYDYAVNTFDKDKIATKFKSELERIAKK